MPLISLNATGSIFLLILAQGSLDTDPGPRVASSAKGAFINSDYGVWWIRDLLIYFSIFPLHPFSCIFLKRVSPGKTFHDIKKCTFLKRPQEGFYFLLVHGNLNPGVEPYPRWEILTGP